MGDKCVWYNVTGHAHKRISMNCFLWEEGDFDHVMGRDGIMGVRDFLPREGRGAMNQEMEKTHRYCVK